MGLSTNTTTATTQFRPFCPSYFKLSRPCPCFFATLGGGSSSSSRLFSNALNRYWAKFPTSSIITLRTGDTKGSLISRNYNAYPALSADTAKPLVHGWSQESEELRESRKRYKPLRNELSQDGSSYSLEDTKTVVADSRCLLPPVKSKYQHTPSTDGGRFLVNAEKLDAALQSNNKKMSMEKGNVAVDQVNGFASENKRPNGLSYTGIAKDVIHTNGLLTGEISDHKKGVPSSEVVGAGACSIDGNGTIVEPTATRATEDKRPNGLSSVGKEKDIHTNGLLMEEISDQWKKELSGEVVGTGACSIDGNGTTTKPAAASTTEKLSDVDKESHCEEFHKLTSIYGNVLVVDNVSMAHQVVCKLINEYRDLVHACDTEVASIDVKQETPIDHGEIICFSIYSGLEADFGNSKSCIWVDVLDGGGKDLLLAFKPFFEDQSIKKVWHNYSFDKHVIENYGISVHGFQADTMHMARLWDSSRRIDGGYSLEALTGDRRVMNGAQSHFKELIGKISMKTIFGKRKVKKDGSEGKIITIAPVEELQRNDRVPWICYSALDAMSTLQLYESLEKKLSEKLWKFDGMVTGKTMFDLYKRYWRPFGELLVRMETEGMLVDRAYLSEIEKIARAEQGVAANRFRNWASKYCADAKYMNVGSDTQLRQLLFGGIPNSKDPSITLPYKRTFKVPNVNNVIEEGKKTPTKFRNIELHQIGVQLPTEMYTASGWPSVSGDALKALAGKVSVEYYFMDHDSGIDSDFSQEDSETKKLSFFEDVDTSTYGLAFKAFETREEGIEACHAIASLCEVCSIDSLISNFILPLQGNNISGKSGRVHCSLNINTETGRLSARRPNLQNQPALEKDRYKIRQAFVAAPGTSLIVADYGQLELRILAHLANCKSMLHAFEAGGDFHSRTAMNMYPHIRNAIENKQVLLEWYPQPGEERPPVPLLKDAFGSERRKAKMLNFSIAYGKTPVGLARDWKVSVEEAKDTVDRWYSDRKEVLKWQEARKKEARFEGCVHTLLGRARNFPSMKNASRSQRNHIERAAINTPVQGSAADVAMCAMLQISENVRLKELGWRLLLQVHDEVILEGPTESAEVAKAIVVECMSKPFDGRNILRVDLSVDAKCAQNWYAAK